MSNTAGTRYPRLTNEGLVINFARDLLYRDHFFLAFVLKDMFDDFKDLKPKEQQRHIDFLRKTRLSIMEIGERESPYVAAYPIRNSLTEETILVSDRPATRNEMRAGVLREHLSHEKDLHPQKSIAEALEGDPVLRVQSHMPILKLNTVDKLKADFFLRLCCNRLEEKYRKGHDTFKQMELHLLANYDDSAGDEATQERERFRDEVIWDGFNFDDQYTFVSGYVDFIHITLENKKTQFSGSTWDRAAYGAVVTLQRELLQRIQQYINREIGIDVLQLFSNAAIVDAEGVLAQHRGCAGLFRWLSFAMSWLAGCLGMRTDSARKLETLKEQLEEVVTGRPSQRAEQTNRFFQSMVDFEIRPAEDRSASLDYSPASSSQS